MRRVTLGVLEQAGNTRALECLVQRHADGTPKPRVAARLPVERAAEAHSLVEQGGLRGRVVLAFYIGLARSPVRGAHA